MLKRIKQAAFYTVFEDNVFRIIFLASIGYFLNSNINANGTMTPSNFIAFNLAASFTAFLFNLFRGLRHGN